MKPASISTKTIAVVCAATIVGASLLIPSTGKPKAVNPPTVTPRDIGVEVVALEVDANGFVLGAGIVVPPEWKPADAQKHCQSANQYILWKMTDGTRKPDRGWQLIDGAWMPVKPYTTWTQDKTKQSWIPDVAPPVDASITKTYYYVLPDTQKGETKGNWNLDPAKKSPPATAPPLDPQTYPKPTKAAMRWSSLRECSLDSNWNQIHCTVSAEWVCVAGGGGGASGGGGAGGLLDGTGANALTISSGTGYTVTIGAGGSAGQGGNGGGSATAGSNSVFNTGTAVAGAGGEDGSQNGVNGGSGSGASGSGSAQTGGSATQGNSGGATGYGSAGGNTPSPAGGSNFPASGGGGANAVGGASNGDKIAGNGGAGKTFFGASNANTDYAGGGGGGVYVAGGGATAGSGGTGGGGAGSTGSGTATAGTANTGGGGGGTGDTGTGGVGGSGIVMVRCLLSDSVSATGGTHTADATYDVWRFTASGTWTPTFGAGVNHNGDFFQLFGVRFHCDLWDERKRVA